MQIVIAIIVFCVIIIIHELGHFSAARLFGMNVYEFSLGMGPTLLKHRGKTTVYKLRAIPFGGSVQLGEDEVQCSDPNDFRNKPVWQRMIVILSGVFMNIILGFVVCFAASAFSSVLISTTIGGFRDNAVSSEKLMAGDDILAINHMSVLTASDISYQLYNSSTKLTDSDNTAVFDFTVRRNGEKLELENVTFNAAKNAEGGRSIAFDFYVNTTDKTFASVINQGARQAVSLSRLIILTLADIAKGTYGINDFAGPVGVVGEIGHAASVSAEQLFTIVALITLNVAIFNLIPIPGLDGARFLFFVIEAVRKKPVKPEIEGMIHFAGFLALMLLMVVVTFNDVKKLIFGA